MDLYHGAGEFLKVYPGDVSRNFPGGTINLVIYPKPSLLKFTGEATIYEEIIDMSWV